MSLLDQAPSWTGEQAVRVARDVYGLTVRATTLPSERDQNFRLDVEPEAVGHPSATFVLKIANAGEAPEMLQAQNAAMAHVSSRTAICPRVVRTPDASDIAIHDGHCVRLLTWLPGVPLGAIRHRPAALLEDLGRSVAHLTLALQSFDHPAIHRVFHWDLARAVTTCRERLPLVADESVRAAIEQVVAGVAADAAALFGGLPRSAIHNDANDYNVLVSGDPFETRAQITGIIDFGDMVHSFTVADVAVAIAYAILGTPRPLEAAAAVVRGYHAVRRLSDVELRALWRLVQLRLCLSVCIAADQQRQRPGDSYLSISQGPIQHVWPALTDTAGAEEALREARATADAVARRRTLTARNLSLAYDSPVRVVRGSMQYLFDDRGRRYLDAYNNVPHVGHSHPRVAEAVSAQLRTLNTNTRYLQDALAEYAERLTATFRAPLTVCVFVNSGSEANELAIRLARAHTRQRDVVVLEAAYHGNTNTLIDISPYKFAGPGGEGRPEWVHVAPLPDPYRGAWDAGVAGAGEKYGDHVGEIVERLSREGRGLCAFIAETCPSVAGQIVPPVGYLQRVYEHVRGAGGVCIADEVQTAYGRMGTSFYAFEDQAVTPDIVVLGKPIGNGYPLGAVVTTEEIAASFDTGMEFFSTFGGSSAACAAGLAVLDVVRGDRLQAHAARIGDRLLGALRSLAARHPLVGDVRGSGLFLGVDLVRDRASREPATREAAWIVNRMREEGVLLGTDGPFHNVLKIRPPMPFSAADADLLAEVLDRVLTGI